MKRKAMTIIISILLGIAIIIIVAGLILPDERTEKRQTVFDAGPETVYNIITNNEDYAYRSDLKEIIIVEKKGDFEVWDEVAGNGNTIRFRTTKKVPFSRYEFDIVEANGFTGHWIGEIKETGPGQTLFTATEIIRIKNPVIKVLSYLFFDIGKFMETYQEDVKRKIESLE